MNFFRIFDHTDMFSDDYTGELFTSLRGRLSDSNKNLVTMTLTTLGNLASAMGPAVDKTSKVWLMICFHMLSEFCALKITFVVYYQYREFLQTS